MAAPGWYPDPESMSRERFWDGDGWTTQVRESGTQVRPAMPGEPGGSEAPPTAGQAAPTVIGGSPVRPPGQPGQPGQPGEPFRPFNPSAPLPDLDALDAREAAERTRLPGPPPGGPPAARARYVAPGTPAGPTGGRRTGLLVGLVVLALVVVGGGVAAFLLLGGEEDTDTGVDPPAPTTPSASPRRADLCDSGDPTTTQKQPDDGRVHGGGLSFEAPRGYRLNDDNAFAYNFATAVRVVVTPVAGDYTATYAVGSIDRSDFGTLEEAATSVSECYASGNFYVDPLPTYVPGDSEELTVDGRDAVSIRAELQLVDAAIPGGDLQVVVVDTDDPDAYGLFVGDQVLGDDAQLEEREQVVAGLEVE